MNTTPTTTERSLDRKLAAIAAGAYSPGDFIIADAKDADMAFGARSAGPRGRDDDRVGPGVYRTRGEYLDAMRALLAQGELDILLASASNAEVLAAEGAFSDVPVTLAVRANDTTDIWNQRGGGYPGAPSRPFRSANLDVVRGFCDLVLYSVTFNNDLKRDLRTVQEFREFRADVRQAGIRYFLEVFNPNAPRGLRTEEIGAFVNDSILRTLAGVTRAERPLFLKMAYNGADALAELVEHDPGIVVGILGGSAGTTRDTFELLHRAEAAGARVALFGRKIQRAESQLHLVALMRPVLRGDLSPADGVRAYHDALGAAGIPPHRELAADLEVTDPVLARE